MERFIIISFTRVGTTMLGDMLNSHPTVKYFGEVYNPDEEIGIWHDWYYEAFVNRQEHLRKMKRADIMCLFVNSMAIETRNEGMGCFGFNIKYNDLYNLNEVYDTIVRTELKVIHLRRNNLLSLVCSSQLHNDAVHDRRLYKFKGSKKDWDGRKGGNVKKKVKQVKSRIDITAVLKSMRSVRDSQIAITGSLMEKGMNVLDLTYEELTENKTISVLDKMTTKRLCDHIGIDNSHKLSTEYVKMNSPDPRDLIENFDEVAKIIQYSEFAEMLK